MKSILLFFSKLTIEKKFLLVLVTPILTVLLSIKLILLGLAFIIFLDLITGIRKSMHLQDVKFQPFKKIYWKRLFKCVKSKGMRDTWRKTYEYVIGICAFAALESMVLHIEPFTIMDMTFTLTEFAVATASVIEIYSIFENMEAVSGNNLLKVLIKIIMKPKEFVRIIRERRNGIIKSAV